jgi:hypothetical protein
MLTQDPPDPGDIHRAASSVGGRKTPARTGVRPDFFIVGAPKCGTSSLADYLGGHPDIFMARKEMHFFGSDLRFAGHFYRRAEREYLAEGGEASVWYLFSEQAAAEIHAFNPSARIIIMLREPAEMMYSLFHYFRYDGNEPLRTFAAALKAEPERRAGRRLGRQTYFAQGLAYRATARYFPQVRRYIQTFGRERVHVVLSEDLAADAAGVYRDTLKFLGVDTAHRRPQFNRVNPAQTVKSRALRAVLNDPAVRSTVLAVRPLLPNRVFKCFQHIGSVLQSLNSSAERHPPLDPAQKAMLRGEFAEDVAALGGLIGRDLSQWTAPPRP